jgi:hypothetical protein
MVAYAMKPSAAVVIAMNVKGVCLNRLLLTKFLTDPISFATVKRFMGNV